MSEIYLVEADENGEILDAELIDDNFDSTAEYAEDDEEEYEDDEEEYEEGDAGGEASADNLYFVQVNEDGTTNVQPTSHAELSLAANPGLIGKTLGAATKFASGFRAPLKRAARVARVSLRRKILPALEKTGGAIGDTIKKYPKTAVAVGGLGGLGLVNNTRIGLNSIPKKKPSQEYSLTLSNEQQKDSKFNPLIADAEARSK